MVVGYPEDLDDAAWEAHDHAVDQCRGQICLCAIAEHFGLPAALSDVGAVEVKCQAHEGGCEADLESNGTIRRWCTVGNNPRRDSIEKINMATGGRVDLDLLIKHPIITLLRREPPSIQQLNGYLEQAPLGIRKILILEPDLRGIISHHRPDRRTVLTLRNTWSFDGFIAMLCLARRGEVLGEAPAHALPAMCAYDMFPRVVQKTSLIRLQWQRLADCLHRVFWRRVYVCGISPHLPLELLTRNIERRLLNPRARYKYRSGRLLSEERDLQARIEFLGSELKNLRAHAGRMRSHKHQMKELNAVIDQLKSR